jgi:hypothetical protein
MCRIDPLRKRIKDRDSTALKRRRHFARRTRWRQTGRYTTTRADRSTLIEKISFTEIDEQERDRRFPYF